MKEETLIEKIIPIQQELNSLQMKLAYLIQQSQIEKEDIYLYEDVESEYPGINGTHFIMRFRNGGPQRNQMLEIEDYYRKLYVIDSYSVEGIYKEPVIEVIVVIVTDDSTEYLPKEFAKRGTHYTFTNFKIK